MDSATHHRQAWTLLALLVGAMVVSFFDRGNLAVAAPVLAPELGLSSWQLGLLLSAFFWTYAACQIPAGWLVDRIEVRWVYAVGFLLWSMATLGTAAAASFGGLLSMRLLLGVGESITYPATSRVLAAVFPEQRRGLANSLVDLGARLGPALGTMCGALLVAAISWRGLFVVTGLGALIWLAPWLACAPRQLAASAHVTGPDWSGLLRRKAVWGTCAGLCGANYAWYFLLSWLPSYLVRERHFSLNSVAIWGAMPYVCMAISSITGGILADRWIARGASAVRVRRGFLVTGLVLTAVLLPSVLLPHIEWAIGGLLLSCLAFGIYASNVFALTQTLAGPDAAGRWTGLQNACGNLAGIVSPALTGWIVSTTGHFAIAFIAAGMACLCGASSFHFLVKDHSKEHGQALLITKNTVPAGNDRFGRL
ncbi:MAG TPA: MFS transporter [Bryobacteraceae bacterium]|nr:MFS transporter [Bryobacteraceae bacterium]